MKKITDITPEQVEAAYLKTHLLPEAEHADVRNGRCCALGALLAEANENVCRSGLAGSMQAIGYDIKKEDYFTSDAADFGCGFDDAFSGRDALEDEPNYNQGFRVGEHIRKVFGGRS